jgi:hypothetical protein
MRVLEILQEGQTTNEAPVGMIRQGLRKMGSAAAGAVGAKGLSANLSGKVASGDKANRLFVDYNRYLGQIDKSFGDATAGDLKDFLVGRKLGDKHVTGNDDDVLSKDEINDVFVKVATDSYRKTRPSVAPAAGSPQQFDKVLDATKNLSDEEKSQIINYLQRSLKGRTQQPTPDNGRVEPSFKPSNDNVSI